MEKNNVLVTGGNGFLGKNIVSKFRENSFNVFTLGKSSADYTVDISNEIPSFNEYFYTVVHCAGKAHSIPKSESEKKLFYEVNLEGTKNLLNALSKKPPKFFVFASTVAVYGLETGKLVSEKAPLKGNSPYADSKIQAEKFILQWGRDNNVLVLILRLPLIVGINPPGNLGKMINGIKTRKYLSIGEGKARRSMVMAEDIGKCIVDNIEKEGIYNLSDGYHPTFREIEEIICKELNKPKPLSIPFWFAKLLGIIGDIFSFFPINSDLIIKMTNDLTFDSGKASRELIWRPSRVTQNFHLK